MFLTIWRMFLTIWRMLLTVVLGQGCYSRPVYPCCSVSKHSAFHVRRLCTVLNGTSHEGIDKSVVSRIITSTCHYGDRQTYSLQAVSSVRIGIIRRREKFENI